MLKSVDLESLSLHLNQLSDALVEFEHILDQECEVLKSPDISPLTTIVEQKGILSDQVSKAFDLLASSISDEPLSLKEFMLLDTFKSLPPSTQTLFEKLSSQITVCNNKNTANGLSVQALNTLNETLIQIFRGKDLQSRTYNASGNASSSPTPTNTIGKA